VLKCKVSDPTIDSYLYFRKFFCSFQWGHHFLKFKSIGKYFPLIYFLKRSYVFYWTISVPQWAGIGKRPLPWRSFVINNTRTACGWDLRESNDAATGFAVGIGNLLGRWQLRNYMQEFPNDHWVLLSWSNCCKPLKELFLKNYRRPPFRLVRLWLTLSSCVSRRPGDVAPNGSLCSFLTWRFFRCSVLFLHSCVFPLLPGFRPFYMQLQIGIVPTAHDKDCLVAWT